MPLSREAIDYARVAQAVVALVAALVPWLAELTDEANTAVVAVSALILAFTEAKKRRSVTPVEDPKTDAGTPLVPAG